MKTTLKIIYIIILLVACFLFYRIFIKEIPQENLIWTTTWSINTWFINSIPVEIPINTFEINEETCEIINTGEYQVNNIYEEEVIWFDKNDYLDYTRYFEISPWFEEAYFCIVADVKPELQNPSWKYYLYFLVNWWYMWWLVNVWFSKNNNSYYDYTTSNDKRLNWRMYGTETPKWYFIDLNKVIVADYENWWYKVISPINQLNEWGKQRIWGMVSAWENGIIRKFILIHKGWDITRIEE